MRGEAWVRTQLERLEREIVEVILAPKPPTGAQLDALQGKLRLRERLARRLHRLQYDTRECLVT